MYGTGVMNQDTSTESSLSSSVNAETISRRAYELWEKEGRPNGCDLRHWLEAEKECQQQPQSSSSEASASTPPPPNTDVRPLQGTRAASAANREPKRGSNPPFGNDQKSGKRRAAPTPAL